MERQRFEDSWKEAFKDAEATPSENLWNNIEARLEKSSHVAQNMEDQKFEASWKEAFKGAEVAPSENLWTNLELELEKADGGKMKRRILFYKMLAAASVLFAMTFAGTGIYYMNKSDEAARNLAIQQQNTNKGAESNSTSEENAASSSTAIADNTEVTSKDNSVDAPNENAIAKTSEVGQSNDDDQSDRDAKNNTALATADNADTRTGANAKESTTKQSENRVAENLSANTAETKNNGENENKLTLTNNAVAANKESANTKEQVAGKEQQVNRVAVNRSETRTSESNVVNVAEENNSTTRSTSIADNSRVVNGSPVINEQAIKENDNLAQAKSSRPALANTQKIKTYKTDKPQVDPVQEMLARLDQREKTLRDEEKKEKRSEFASNEKLWTSLGFAAGSFTTASVGTPPMAQSGFNGDHALVSNAMVQEQTRASGISYSVGLSVGTRISNRWVLSGGVNYLNQSSEYSSHTALRNEGKSFAAASLNQLKNSEYSERVTVAEYDVNNSLQYLNIPLQAGYLIVNRKVGLQVNAGISTDLFLQNVVTPEGSLETTRQGSGPDSPYRAVNFSGLMGTEISYRFAKRYRVSVNPGLRYPFSSIYKSDLGIDATPLTFDIGLRFRYIFH